MVNLCSYKCRVCGVYFFDDDNIDNICDECMGDELENDYWNKIEDSGPIR